MGADDDRLANLAAEIREARECVVAAAARLGMTEDEFLETLVDSLASELDDSYPPRCTNLGGHEWAYSGTRYGGDDESFGGEGRCYCIYCGADGDA